MGAEPSEPHSAAFFGRMRDFWWNQDHVELLAARLALGRVRSVLDVGAGVGHWGRLLGSVLSPEATLVGIDREPAWVAEATRRAHDLGLADRFRYEQGCAEALPFPDADFDLVTCQTLLIHVSDPEMVVREMLRVTKPGGLIVVSEPNNRAPLLVDTSETAGYSIDARGDLLRFYLTCERGKTVLGEGNNSVGDLVPGYLARQGVVEIQTFLSDKASAVVPPYATEEQRLLSSDYADEAARGRWGWSRREAKRFFLAGGGAEIDFDAGWERRMSENRAAAGAVERGAFHTAGGGIHYVVSGRRPIVPTGD